jgi:hypothetical protein
MAVILKIRGKVRHAGEGSAVIAIQNVKLRKYAGKYVSVTISN